MPKNKMPAQGFRIPWVRLKDYSPSHNLWLVSENGNGRVVSPENRYGIVEGHEASGSACPQVGTYFWELRAGTFAGHVYWKHASRPPRAALAEPPQIAHRKKVFCDQQK